MLRRASVVPVAATRDQPAAAVAVVGFEVGECVELVTNAIDRIRRRERRADPDDRDHRTCPRESGRQPPAGSASIPRTMLTAANQAHPAAAETSRAARPAVSTEDSDGTCVDGSDAS